MEGDYLGGDPAGGAAGLAGRAIGAFRGRALDVPAGCPHAFFNPNPEPARMLFMVSPAGHERYLRELNELLAAPGPPDQARIAQLRLRHDIHQLTPLTNRAPDSWRPR